VPVEQAWAVLTDVELIAPCMPGAQLQEVEGDEYRGIVKVKVGPITAQYKGAARFVEKDDAAHKAVLRAEGRDTRGQGNANATITATLTPDGDGTAVTVGTDLTVTGRVAQFGRGVMADVSSKLLGQFVDCLENKLLVDVAGPDDLPSAAQVEAREAASRLLTAGEPAHGPLDLASEGAAAARAVDVAADEVGAASSSSPPTSGARLDGTSGPSVRAVDSAEPEPVDLLEAAGAPVAKRAIPAIVGLTVLWLLSVFLRRRRRRRRS
jgi:carbon monoxide dehydrogenase subunit G